MALGTNSIKTGKKILFGTGRMISIFECFFVIMFYPYSLSLHIPAYVFLPVVLFAALIPVLILPYIYNAVNSSPLVTLGKYHPVIIIGTLGLSIFTSLFFSMTSETAFAVKVTNLFFSVMFIVLFLLLFLYVYSSINARMCSHSDKKMSVIKSVFSFAGAVAFLFLLTFFPRGGVDYYSDIANIVATATVIIGVIVYLSTVWQMPRFIRLEKPKKRTLRQKYSRFFVSLLYKENIRFYIYFLFLLTALMILLFNIFAVSERFSLSPLFSPLAALIASAGAAAGYKAFSNTAKNHPARNVIFGSSLAVLSVIVLSLPLITQLIMTVNIILLFTAALILGFSGGIFIPFIISGLNEAKEQSNSTSGMITNIRNIIFILSFVLALIVAVICDIFKEYSLISRLSIAAGFVIISVFINFVKKKYLTLQFPGVDDDTGV